MVLATESRKILLNEIFISRKTVYVKFAVSLPAKAPDYVGIVCWDYPCCRPIKISH
jgi:hypothetical protein